MIERGSVLLTRAQCTRNHVVHRCWPDPAGHVWPGRPVCCCRVYFSDLIGSPCLACLPQLRSSFLAFLALPSPFSSPRRAHVSVPCLFA